MGPLTHGGCSAVCPGSGFECYGCRGTTEDANFSEFFSLLNEKGFSDTEIKKHMETFCALEVNKKLEGTNWQQLH